MSVVGLVDMVALIPYPVRKCQGEKDKYIEGLGSPPRKPPNPPHAPCWELSGAQAETEAAP
jgi:hypothetical protein